MRAQRQLHLPGCLLLALVAEAIGCGAEVRAPALTVVDARPDRSPPDRPSPDRTSPDGPADRQSDAGPGPDVSAETPRPDAGPELPPPADAGPADATSALRCNGHEALCDRRFDQVVFPASHNAMSNAEAGFFAPNQPHRIRRQLQDGIRALLLDTWAWRGGAYLCHTACELGNQRLADGLAEIAGFLRASPHEVIALLVEDGLPAGETERAFQDSGLVGLVHVQPSGVPWPTLRQMIDRGQRLVVTAEHGRPPPAWYHHLWDVAWDTPYSFKNQGEFSCRLNRGKRENALFLLNHWVENPLPSQLLSRDANRREVLLARARQCQMESGRLPNFVAVNHYTQGDLLAVVRELNGL